MKMEKKKILTLIGIVLIITVLTIGVASAATKTIKVKEGKSYNIKIDKEHYIGFSYNTKHSQQYIAPRFLQIELYTAKKGSHGCSIALPKQNYEMTKVEITFKKSNGKYVTKTYKHFDYSTFYMNVPKNLKPVKVKVYYQTKKKHNLYKHKMKKNIINFIIVK